MAIPCEMTRGNRMRWRVPLFVGACRNHDSQQTAMPAPGPIDLGRITFFRNAACMDDVNERVSGEPGA